ncbi:(+)-neomenthol dehydrogenase [Ranunculus cassubicifolius]
MEEASLSSPETRYAVVTGGNKGIGLEICRQLASHGVFVILTARDDKRGTEAVENLKKSGVSNVIYHQLDVTDAASIGSLANFIHTQLKKLDILVNNAGISGVEIDQGAIKNLPYGAGTADGQNPDLLNRILKQTYRRGEDCIKTNYYGTKEVTEALLPFLQLSNSANVVNVSSQYGQLKHIPNEKVKMELNNVESLTEERLDELLQCFLNDLREDKLESNGWPVTVSAYKVSKVAVNAYTRMIAYKYPNMRINCVHPGYVKTDISFNRGILSPEEGAKGPVKLALCGNDGHSGQYFDQTNRSAF